jgi:methylglutaconyl-CoA hydratase
MAEYTQLEINNGIARLSLNRPEKRNALKREFIEELNGALQSISADRSVRVLVLAAEGKVFCAGMDLGQMQQRAQSENGKSDWQKDSQVYCDLLKSIFSLPIPTIAAVQGPALAGGFGLVLACDMVVAAKEGFVMLPEPMRGITAAMVTPLLIHRIGSGPATFMLLSGERISAARAHQYGLVHAMVEAEDFQERVNQLTQAVLTGSPEALAITKRHLHHCSADHIMEQLDQSITVSAEARETDDAREGLAAFLEKRSPNWQPETRS